MGNRNGIKLSYLPLIGTYVENNIIRGLKDDRITKNPTLWKNNVVKRITEIQLQSFETIGGELGFGGSKIFYGQIRAISDKNNDIISVPIVLKISDEDEETSNELVDTYENYNLFINYVDQEDCASPFMLYPESGKHRVLWSYLGGVRSFSKMPFRMPLELKDRINEKKFKEVKETLRYVYDEILDSAHAINSPNVEQEIDLVELYKNAGYFNLKPNNNWHKRYLDYFNIKDDNTKISVFDCEVLNPFVFLEKLFNKEYSIFSRIYTSAVHGDLHPRNIIKRGNSKPKLIDFEKTKSSFHTIIDFSLMESSIRFFYLVNNISLKELEDFERITLKDFRVSYGYDFSNEILSQKLGLIRFIRAMGNKYIIGEEENHFILQYLFPLFVNTMGTFAYINKIDDFGYLLLSAGLLAEKLESVIKKT